MAKQRKMALALKHAPFAMLVLGATGLSVVSTLSQ
jgi:hypothetical protein